MAKAYSGDALAKRVFIVVLFGVALEIMAMV
jgi:hypothetical protein